MGTKLLWTGLTISLVASRFIPDASLVGGIIMVIGAILLWMDK